MPCKAMTLALPLEIIPGSERLLPERAFSKILQYKAACGMQLEDAQGVSTVLDTCFTVNEGAPMSLNTKK